MMFRRKTRVVIALTVILFLVLSNIPANDTDITAVTGDVSQLIATEGAQSAKESLSVVQSERIGIGGGGAFFLPMIDPSDSNNFYVVSDMGGLYYSHDRGATWGRSETHGAINEACIANDGTLFVGGYGLYASTDNGQTLELIYPKAVKKQISRCGWNEFLFLADDYNNGYIVGVTTSEDRIWFATVDWGGEFRLMSADFSGDNLETIHVEHMKGITPTRFYVSMVVTEDCLYYTSYNDLIRYSFRDKTLSMLYRSEIKIMDIKKIDQYLFLLDKTSDCTRILYTEDFSSWKDLMDKNQLDNTFNDGKKERTFNWHFKEISGNNFQNIFLSFTSDVSDGILKFNGETFSWVFDSMYNTRYQTGDENWTYGSHGPFYGIYADPSDDNFCLVSNIETVYMIHYGDNDRKVKSVHCTALEDGSYTTTGLDVQTTYFVHEDPFDPEHIIITTTDMGLQISTNGGRSFSRMQITGDDPDLYNTCYDLYFDSNTKDLVYALWSNRHDAPYEPDPSDRGWTQGAFAVSYDGGNTWDFSYSSGLPKDCIPVKMSLSQNGDHMTIAVATFNRGFFISHDGGKTFISISEDMTSINGLIWGEDVVLIGNNAYCLTAPYNYIDGSWNPSVLYNYDLKTGSTKVVDLGDLTLVRSLTYDQDASLYLNVIPTFRKEYSDEFNSDFWVNENGGVYRYDGSSITCVFASEDGIFNSSFSEDGTMYAVSPYGKLFYEKSGSFHLLTDELFLQLKNISFSSQSNTVYVTTFGGGTYRITISGSDTY